MLIEDSAETVVMSTVIVGWRQRWQKGTRYYEVLLHQDLWGAWIVTRVWGRRSSPLGRVRHQPCESHAEGLHQVQQIQQRRARRGYALVGDVPLDQPVRRV
jgi:hypothetical protein